MGVQGAQMRAGQCGTLRSSMRKGKALSKSFRRERLEKALKEKAEEKSNKKKEKKNKKLKTRRKGDAFGSGGEDVDLVPSLAEFIRTGEERLIHLWKCRSKNYNPVS